MFSKNVEQALTNTGAVQRCSNSWSILVNMSFFKSVLIRYVLNNLDIYHKKQYK